MSNFENEKIYESSLEKALENGLDEAVFSELDLEECFDYLMTGELPERYDRIAYRMYKS